VILRLVFALQKARFRRFLHIVCAKAELFSAKCALRIGYIRESGPGPPAYARVDARSPGGPFNIPGPQKRGTGGTLNLINYDMRQGPPARILPGTPLRWAREALTKFFSRASISSGAKARVDFAEFAARLKSCPDTKQALTQCGLIDPARMECWRYAAMKRRSFDSAALRSG
jgi:hypothetical protein